MPQYTFQWDYTSSYGSGAEGETVDLDVATAAAINRDSPGVLAFAASERAVAGPPKDRQVKGAQNRAAESPIDKTTYKAVRDKA